MKTKILKKSIVVLIAVLFLTLALFGTGNIQGFSGVFAPNNWEIGSNAPAGVILVDISGAPATIKLKNYSSWMVSGATFRYPNIPSDGVISFSYTIAGTTTGCPATYSVNQDVVILSGNENTATVHVAAGDSFCLALNGKNLPDDFGCRCGGRSVTFEVSDFSFIPDQQPVEMIFYPYNPIYQATDGKPYTITISNSNGTVLYTNSGTTDAGFDTYYGTSYGREVVPLPIGIHYTIHIEATAGGDLYEYTNSYFNVVQGMDPHIKILHGAYSLVE